LLDEPTNHLDLEMRRALTLALQEYTGALVAVSHDRHLLRSVTDRLWLVDGGGVTAFDGDLEDYRRWLLARERPSQAASQQPVAEEEPESGEDPRQRRKDAAERRQQLKPLKKEIQRLEKELDRLHRRKQELDQVLADPGLYAADQKERLAGLLEEQGQVKKELEDTEAAWLAASEEWEEAAG